MLPALVFIALAAFTAALLGSPAAGRASVLHLILAVGAMPLIFGAMGHFIPVLTRTRGAPARLGVVPVLALAGGALVVASLSLPGMPWGRHAGAFVAATAAAVLLAWSWRRRTGMLGRPHPGLAWYQTALACLVFALLAILASAVWPAQWPALRRLHLHLNTLGFIGMTAFGTLTVLMPTVTGKPDPGAALRLRRDFPLAVTGTLLVAVGAAWSAPLAAVGAVLWAIPPVRLAANWLRLYRTEVFKLHGAAPLLAAALVGFVLSLLYGAAALSPVGLVPVWIYVAGFLPPLVTGAASQLLPVWLRPGVQNAWHGRLRGALGRYAGVRAVLFCIGGAVAGTGREWGLLLGAATLLWFIVQAVAALIHATILQKEHTP